MVTGVLAVTGEVVTGRLAEPSPPGTFPMGGTWATAALLVASVTDTPPAGALALRDTVPETLVPPATLAAPSVTEARRGGALGSGPTLMNAVFVTPPAVALMRAPVAVVTGVVVIPKLFVLFPAAMVTLGGTWTTDGLSLASVTTPPPGGAGMTSSTVPRPEPPPINAEGLTPIAKSVGGLGGPGSTSSSAACVPPVVPYVP